MINRKNRKVVVIGGGISGLSTAAYLEMNGFDAIVVEKGREPGGVMVPWIRKGFNFDGATNWLPGSSKGAPEIYNIINEILDIESMEFINYEKFMDIERDGEVFSIYQDAEKLREEMMRIGSEDRIEIDKFIDTIKIASNLKVPFADAADLLSPIGKIKFLFSNIKMIKFFFKWKSISIDKYVERFSNKILREGIKDILPHHSFFDMLALLIPLGWMNRNAAGYPMGGSRKFIDLVEKRAKDLGTEIRYKSPVKTIIVENSSAKGVLLEDGTEVKSDFVISTADLKQTVNSMLSGKYSSKSIKGFFDDHPVFPGMIQISIGVKGDFSKYTQKILHPLISPLKVDAKNSVDSLLVRIGNFDSCFAPEGSTSLIVHLRGADYNYWAELRKSDREKYREEKSRILEAVIDSLDARFGNIRDNVEVTDVATPATYNRYTDSYRGSYQAWAPTNGTTGVALSRKLDGLNDFYLAGHWISTAGGMPRAIVLGRQAVQKLCLDNNYKFYTDSYIK